MGSSMSSSIDWLVSQVKTAMQALDPTIVVFEGWANDQERRLVVVNRLHPESDEALTGDQMLVVLGAGRVDEVYEIPILIDVWDGTDDSSIPRKLAVKMFDAIAKPIAQDRTLGGSLINGGYSAISPIRSSGTGDEDDATAGRRYVISFSVVCKSNYIP